MEQIIKIDEISHIINQLDLDPIGYGSLPIQGRKELLACTRIIVPLKGILELDACHEKYFVRPHDFIILTAKTSFTIHAGQGIYMYIDYTCGMNSALQRLYHNYDLVHPQYYPQILHRRDFTRCGQLDSMVRSTDIGVWLFIKWILQRFFLMAFIYRMKNDPVPLKKLHANHSEELLYTCIDYIQENCSLPLTVGDIAKKLGYSENYIYRIFEKHLHTSCKSFILSYKLNESLRMLVRTDDNLEVIAEKLGFSSAYHFSATFKKEYGISPRDFRSAYLSHSNGIQLMK